MLIPKDWLPNVKMKRIITHWTAGTHKASDFERGHYHILIEGDGKLVRGARSIADNVRIIRSGAYAAHTGEANTGSIGVSLCCMAGCSERPFNPGSHPMTEKQWDTLAQVVAELCKAYNIPVTPSTVLAHGEVHTKLGTRGNRGKWDPCLLPFRPELTRSQVCDQFRAQVKHYLAGGMAQEGSTPPVETHTAIRAVIRGETFTEAILDNGTSFVRARAVAEKFGWGIEAGPSGKVLLTFNGAVHTLPAVMVGDSNYVHVKELANALKLPVGWDGATKTVTVG